MLDPGTGVNPNAEYTQPIEISLPVAGVNSLHAGVELGVGVFVGVKVGVIVFVGVQVCVGVFEGVKVCVGVFVGVGVTKALHN